MTYTVAASNTSVARTATLTVAGKPYKVSQAACIYTLNATSFAFPPAGGDNSVNLTTGNA